MKGPRSALNKNSYWSSMALFYGPNIHAFILTIECYSIQFLFDYIQKNKTKFCLDKEINKPLPQISYTNDNKGSWW